MMIAMYLLRLAKRHVLALSSEEIKPVAFSTVGLCLTKGISELVS